LAYQTFLFVLVDKKQHRKLLRNENVGIKMAASKIGISEMLSQPKKKETKNNKPDFWPSSIEENR